MPKAYSTVKDDGILLNAYAVRNQGVVGKDDGPLAQELIKRSISDDGFTVVVVSDKWFTIMGERKDFVQNVRDTARVKAYFNYVKGILVTLSNFKRGVINFEPDPFGSFSKIIRQEYSGDPANVPVPLSKVDFPEIKELDPPDNFAGFWQVIDFLREKYAPQIMLAPTIKEWGIPVRIIEDKPSGGWSEHSPGVKEMCDYYERYGVNWDALAFNINDKKRSDDDFKTIVEYFSSVAKGMKNHKTGKRVYSFIWKAKVNAYHYSLPVDQWPENEISFEFRNIPFLAGHGVRGMVIGYGSQLAGKYTNEKEIPDIFTCWLKEYFIGEKQGCDPQGTLGVVKVKEY